jgi:hypothetical protein
MSTSSLYGTTSNVIVSSNNVTTLYNTSGGNVVTANVPDRDFTTLYTKQSDIKPTLPYGNANVEAFLNIGHDTGGNIVQNIRADGNITANGNLTINGITSLNDVANVHILGGSSGYVLTTDGQGNLEWLSTIGGNSAPYIHFDVTSTGNNQQFTDANIEAYSSNLVFSLFKNGVNIEPFYYEKTDPTTVQVNILLNDGDTVDILPSGGGGLPAGVTGEVQFNGGYTFGASSAFTFDTGSETLSVTNANIGSITTNAFSIPSATDLTIGGGSANYVLATDGLGHIQWQSQVGANGFPSGSNGEVQFNSGSNSFASSANLTYNNATGVLTSSKFSGNGSLLTTLTGANVTGVVANATYSVNANFATSSESANTSNIAYSVSGANVVGTVSSATTAATVTSPSQPAITSVGAMTGLASTGTVNFSTASNVSLGGVANVHITGGSANFVLQTDGAGNLAWVTPLTANATPGGANTQVQFNDNGLFGGNSSFSFNKTTSILTVPTVSTSTITNVVGAVETVIFTGGVSSTLTFDTTYSSIIQATTNTSANFVINFTNLSLSTGQARTFAYINKNASGAIYRCTGISIGGSSQTVNWLGGVAPTVGSQNDIYNVTIIKTGSSTYSVFASVGSY